MAVELAGHHRDEAVSLGYIAKRTLISRRYLEQLALALKHAGVVRAVRGVRGGYQLARPAEQISIADVIVAVIGPINIVDCVCEPRRCCNAEHCEARSVFQLANDKLIGIFNRTTVADLAHIRAQGNSLKERKNNSLGCPAT